MTTGKKLLISAISVLIILLALIAFVLPSFIKTKVLEAIRQETGRTANISGININPLTMRITLTNFALHKAGSSENQFSFASVDTSISLSSLFKGALVVNELTINKPALSLTRTAANRYDFSDIIELQSKKPKYEKKGEFHFAISNISLNEGAIDFNDQLVTGGKHHTINEIQLAIPIISNIPHQIETATAPKFSAIINGSPFNLSGSTKPFSKSLETSVHIDLKKLNIPEYLGYLPVPMPVTIAGALLDMDAELIYKVSADKKPELLLKGNTHLTQLSLLLKNGQPFLKLPSMSITATKLEPFAQNYELENITLEGLELFASRAKSGEWNYQSLIAKNDSPKSKDKTSTKSSTKSQTAAVQQPIVSIASLAIHDATVHLRDAKPAKGFASDIEQIDIDVSNFTNQNGANGDYEISLLLDGATDISANGSFSQKPLKITANSYMDNLPLERLYPYYEPFLTSPLKGSLNTSASIKYDDNGLTAEQITVELSRLAAGYGGKEKLELGRFNLKNGSYQQKQNRFQAQQVSLDNGSIAISKEQNGSLSIVNLLHKKPVSVDKNSVSVSKAAGKKAAGKDFSWKVGSLGLNKINATFTDKSRSDKPKFTLTNSNINITNLTGPTFEPAQLKFSSTFNKATPLAARGTITPQPFHYKGTVNIGRLPIRDFESYFPENINVFIVGGNAEANMDVDISLKDGKALGSYKGSAALRGFHAVDTKAEEDLLKWESLQLDNIQGTLEPFTLALHEIALNSVYSRIIIHKDGTLNLQNLVEKKMNQGQEAGVKESSEQSNQPEKPNHEPPKNIRIDAVTIQDGTLAFSDKHLPQMFETTFFNLGGRVSGLSSDDAKFADVDLRGNLESHSPLLITGKINPLRGDLFVDLKVSFRDIELSPITPYTATFLGYPVEKGKLFLDLKYLINNKKLDSENKVFIDQFTLGEKVESDKATSLPVKLGIALLKDRKGEIHLDLPVTGRTDDPQFSIWGVVWQVVKNLMVKAVTSPFALLSSMFGSGSEDFSSVSFIPGTSRINAAEEQKLTTLAKVLLDRPALKLELKGYVDSEKDPEGYRHELLNRKIRNEKILALSAQGIMTPLDKIESVLVSEAEYPELLKSVYKKEKFPKPRNAIGLIKDITPDEMKKLIVANTKIGNEELQTLARERMVSTFDFLVKKGNVPIERVFQKNDDIIKKPSKESATVSRVEIGTLVQ